MINNKSKNNSNKNDDKENIEDINNIENLNFNPPPKKKNMDKDKNKKKELTENSALNKLKISEREIINEINFIKIIFYERHYLILKKITIF